jgi:hypothetical protein
MWCCDVCESSRGFLAQCEICGKEYCSLCDYIGYNPTNIHICKNHQNDQDMKEVIVGFDKEYRALKGEILDAIRKTVICTNLEKKNEK